MMKEEFERLAGTRVTSEQYRAIEEAYYSFDGGKQAFCEAYKESKDKRATKKKAGEKKTEDMTFEEKMDMWCRNALLNRTGTIEENWRTKVKSVELYDDGCYDIGFATVDVYLPRKRNPSYRWFLYLNLTRMIQVDEKSCMYEIVGKDARCAFLGSRFTGSIPGKWVKTLNF